MKPEPREQLLQQLRQITLEAEQHEAIISPSMVAASWLRAHSRVSGEDAAELRNAAHFGAYYLAQEIVGRRPANAAAKRNQQDVIPGFDVLTRHHPVMRDGELCEVHETHMSDAEWRTVYESHVTEAEEYARKRRECHELERHHRKFAAEMRKRRPEAFAKRDTPREDVEPAERLQ